MPKVPSEELDYVEIDRRLVDCAVEALDYAACAGWKLITEACMGGLISTVLSEAERQISAKRLRHTLSSKNASRLKVSARLIEEFGAMSPQVAEVARGALKCSDADVAVSVTGVTGPDPDERGNPVRLVYFACARRCGPCEPVKCEYGNIDLARFRYQAAMQALSLIVRMHKTHPKSVRKAGNLRGSCGRRPQSCEHRRTFKPVSRRRRL